jgi:phosphohistidine phosphatase SixA
VRETEPVRYLTIVRHCESTPARAGESDLERTLSERGRLQCAQLREWASNDAELGAYGPTTALVSSSARTRETFERSFRGTAFAGVVEFSDLIYNGRREVTGEDLLIDLAALDPVTTSLLVVAHNPTVAEVMWALADPVPKKILSGRFPLGAAYVLELPDDQPVGLRRYRLAAKYVPD